jgi:mono/diheme cytochrome c family protein
MLKKILLTLLVLVVVVIAGAAAFVASRQNLKFDAPYPPIEASTDSAVVARGRYIVRAAAPCAGCHGDPAQAEANRAGADVPLSGGTVFDIPPGKFYVRNITPDAETGIGRVEPRAIARALRTNVGHDGRALLPFMEFQGFSDEDLAAAVSYLYSQPPVHNPIPNHEYSVLGRVIRATVLANPIGPKQTPPPQSPRGATVENGRYLVESVSLCGACHTARNPMTGEFTGPHLGGSHAFESDSVRSWSPPNITRDPKTGVLARFDEDAFVARFRASRLLPGSPMPWEAYSQMSEDDLRAIHKYLMTVPPAENDVGPPVGPKATK